MRRTESGFSVVDFMIIVALLLIVIGMFGPRLAHGVQIALEHLRNLLPAVGRGLAFEHEIAEAGADEHRARFDALGNPFRGHAAGDEDGAEAEGR